MSGSDHQADHPGAWTSELPPAAVTCRGDDVDAVVATIRAFGFAVVTGLDADGIASFAAALGTIVPQSPRGELVEDVRDVSDIEVRDDRGYRSGGELTVHSDPPTLILLHSVRAARSGGESRLVSVPAIIERLEAETIEALCEGYPMMRVDGQYGAGPAGFDERPLPVLARLGDTLSCVYYRPFIERAAVERGERLSDGQLAALDRFDEAAASNDLALRLQLAPGTTLVLHNRFVLHARTDYVDWPQLERRRHLRRVWIDAPDIVPVADIHRLGDIFSVDG